MRCVDLNCPFFAGFPTTETSVAITKIYGSQIDLEPQITNEKWEVCRNPLCT